MTCGCWAVLTPWSDPVHLFEPFVSLSSSVLSFFTSDSTMQLARIIGSATSTVKHASLEGRRLVVVQPVLADRQSADGDPQLAIDTVAAAVGDLVVITSDGATLRGLLGSDTTPARWSIVALVDPPASVSRT